MTLTPTDERGRHRANTIRGSYKEIVRAIGFDPNQAAMGGYPFNWGFKSEDGRAASVWGRNRRSKTWSAYGDHSLLVEIFGAENVADGMGPSAWYPPA